MHFSFEAINFFTLRRVCLVFPDRIGILFLYKNSLANGEKHHVAVWEHQCYDSHDIVYSERVKNNHFWQIITSSTLLLEKIRAVFRWAVV